MQQSLFYQENLRYIRNYTVLDNHLNFAKFEPETFALIPVHVSPQIPSLIKSLVWRSSLNNLLDTTQGIGKDEGGNTQPPPPHTTQHNKTKTKHFFKQ